MVSFVFQQDMLSVLRASRVLKNTGFSIFQDLSLSMPKRRSKLLQARREILWRKIQAKVFVSIPLANNKEFKFKWTAASGLIHNNSDGNKKMSEILNSDFCY